jgi:hypothetical protein
MGVGSETNYYLYIFIEAGIKLGYKGREFFENAKICFCEIRIFCQK